MRISWMINTLYIIIICSKRIHETPLTYYILEGWKTRIPIFCIQYLHIYIYIYSSNVTTYHCETYANINILFIMSDMIWIWYAHLIYDSIRRKYRICIYKYVYSDTPATANSRDRTFISIDEAWGISMFTSYSTITPI